MELDASTSCSSTHKEKKMKAYTAINRTNHEYCVLLGKYLQNYQLDITIILIGNKKFQKL